MKVVINPVEDPQTWQEIQDFMDELEVPREKIWIMPPGDTRDELIRVYPMVMDWCTKHQYKFTGRPHIIAFDTKREV
jgi:7-carboxy-7-deazaguanine synthase